MRRLVEFCIQWHGLQFLLRLASRRLVGLLVSLSSSFLDLARRVRTLRRRAKHRPFNQYLSTLIPRNGKATRQTCSQRNPRIAFLTMNKFAATFQPQTESYCTIRTRRRFCSGEILDLKHRGTVAPDGNGSNI